jgi:predicted transcriptional regulator
MPEEVSSMTIVVTLSPELEALLRDKAARRGQDVSLVASQLLASVLEWEAQDSQEAIKGIQQGLNDFEAGQFRSFQEFAEQQRRKYNLPVDS